MEEDLKTIQQMLNIEEELWLSTDKSVIVDRITQYIAAMNLLIIFVRQGNLKAFCLTFQKYRIDIKGLGKCFRKTPNMDAATCKVKRDQAMRLFKNVCDKMLTDNI